MNQITITRDKLNKALKDVGYVVNSTIVPILDNVLITVKKDCIHFETSNLNSTIKTRISQANEQEFTMCIDYAKTKAICSQLSTVDVDIIWDEEAKAATIISGKSKAKIVGEDAQFWPEIKTVEESGKIMMTGSGVKDMIYACHHRISDDYTAKPNLCGINIAINDKISQARSMDGHAGVIYEFGTVEFKSNINSTLNAEVRIAKELFEDTEPITITVDKDGYQMTGDHTSMSGKCLDYKFPDMDVLIVENYPKEIGKSLLIDKKLLMSELRRSMLFASGENSVTLHIDTNKIRLEATDMMTGEMYEGEVEIDYQDSEVSISFNAKLLSECLAHSPGDEVELIHFASAAKAMLIIDDNYTAMVMPLKP